MLAQNHHCTRSSAHVPEGNISDVPGIINRCLRMRSAQLMQTSDREGCRLAA
jgi:hypothetical protein